MPSPHKRSFAAEELARQKSRKSQLWIPFGIAIVVLTVAGYLLYSRYQARESVSSGAVSIKSIAVLPLKNLSNDPDQESFTEGMHDILITNLWKISGLRVPGATTVSKYRNTEKSISEIARELHVDAIIEGSVYRIGNTVRINVQLIRGESDSHIWAEEYLMEIQDVLIQQSLLAETIARKIQVKTTAEDKERLAVSYRVNPEAFNAYIKGLNSLKEEITFDSFTTWGNDALDYFQQAVTIDPNFALAYTCIANVYNYWGQFDRMPPREAYPRAKDAAEKALTLNKNLAEAYTQLAWTNLYFDWDMEAAAKNLNRALELNPGYSLVHFYYREYYMTMGRWDEAIEEIRRAQTIEPTNNHYTNLLSITLNRAGKCEEARKEAEKAVKMAPEDVIAWSLLAESYACAGKYDDALNIVPLMEKMGFPSKELQLIRARNLMKLGRRDEARRIYSELIGKYEHFLKTNMTMAEIYMYLGDYDKTFEWLEKAYEERDSWLVWIKGFPEWKPIRSDPRFKALLRKMNLAED